MPATSNTIDLPLDRLDEYDTVWLDESCEAPAVLAIDQTRLPERLVIERLGSKEDVWRAIKRLEVRGAPAIGVCAALGAYVDAWRLVHEPGPAAAAGRCDGAGRVEALLGRFAQDCAYLAGCRPTAVNLAWALGRMLEAARKTAAAASTAQKVLDALRAEAVAIHDEDVRACRSIGENGLGLLPARQGPVGILTHCNAGRLAAVRYGTATAPLYVGRERGLRFKVYCDETRPLLQGARLTAFELVSAGFDTTVLCDGMAASLMAGGKVDAVFVGCDRVARNGDVANKIGTSMVALAAKRYGVPFYVCAPTSTIDLETASGGDIVIEQRDGAEVTDQWYERRMAPEGVGVYNPAFDVTPHDLVTAVVTERGVLRPPFKDSLAAVKSAHGQGGDGRAPHA